MRSLKQLKTIISALSTVVTISYSSSSNAQEKPFAYYNPEEVNPAASLAVLGFNVGVNGLLCGVVAATKNRNVFKEAAQCASGGVLQFGGMVMGTHDYPMLPGVGNQVVSLGTDIINNTVQGKEPLEEIHYNFGPVNFKFGTKNGDVNATWSPLSLAGIVLNAAQGNKFNALDTLSHQTFVFQTPYGWAEETRLGGLTYGNTFSYDPKYPYLKVHENMHRYRFNTLLVTQTLTKMMLPEEFKEKFEVLEHYTGVEIAPDLTWGLMTMPQTICSLAGGEMCGLKWYDWLEFEGNMLAKINEDYTTIIPSIKK